MREAFTTRLDKIANIAAIFTCLLVSIWVGIQLRNLQASRSSTARNAVENVEDANVVVSLEGSASLGSPNAKLVILEFSDFQCPFCGRFARDTYPHLKRDFVANGKVKYVFRNLPLPIHSLAFKAAEAAECSRGQNRYWEMHDQLFANQQALSEADILKHADTIQLNRSEFESCVKGEMRSKIADDQAEAKRLGVQGTPTFLIGIPLADGRTRILRKLNGAQPYQIFKATLDSLIDKVASLDRTRHAVRTHPIRTTELSTVRF